MNNNPNSVIIYTSHPTSSLPQTTDDHERGVRDVVKKATSEMSKITSEVSVDTLKQNVKYFLDNMNEIVNASPQKIGHLTLDEIEINAQIDGKGNIGIAELGVHTGIKFVLRVKP